LDTDTVARVAFVLADGAIRAECASALGKKLRRLFPSSEPRW